MKITTMSKTQKLVLSAMIMAVYIVTVYFTQSFSFGAYQIRIATSLYSLSYLYPFLVLPLGLTNLLANLLCGGLGLLDFVGGLMVGLLTCYTHTLIKKANLSPWLMVLTITFIPGLIVPIWLSYLLQVPYMVLAVSLCIGQFIPGIVGVLFVKVLTPVKILRREAAEDERQTKR